MKRSKRCKVEYVDNIETSFEIRCGEIQIKEEKNEYRIYGRTNDSGWKLLTKKYNKEKAIDYINNLDTKIYNGRIIIEHNKETNTDNPINFER